MPFSSETVRFEREVHNTQVRHIATRVRLNSNSDFKIDLITRNAMNYTS